MRLIVICEIIKDRYKVDFFSEDQQFCQLASARVKPPSNQNSSDSIKRRIFCWETEGCLTFYVMYPTFGQNHIVSAYTKKERMCS